MLRDIDSPKSRAIFAAARHLDALHRLFLASDVVPWIEVDEHIESLRKLAVAHFSGPEQIELWLTELSKIVKSDLTSRSNAKSAYYELVEKLDGDKGFLTVYL